MNDNLFLRKTGVLITSFLFSLFLFASAAVFAKPITGVVMDMGGNPLPGATVTVKGTNITTTTDENGKFSLEVPDNATLVVSYVGFTDQEISVGSQSEINVVLADGLGSELEQVVVVGYGTQRKRDVTGAVKTVKAESMNQGIMNTPQQMIQGKVAGVNVTTASGQPGGAVNISIRGSGSVRSGTTPLFVIDGVALDNSNTGGQGDPLSFINPADIESMDVLKDASATAIYGSRGANGVILVTTKKGKAGTSSLAFNTSAGFSNIARKMPVFNATDFRRHVTESGGTLEDGGGDVNWQDEVMRTGATYDNNLTLSGGTEKLVYYASLSALSQQGILKGSDLKRYTGRFNATQKFWNDVLTLDVSLMASNVKNNVPPINSMLGGGLSNNPTFPIYDAEGKPQGYDLFGNPMLELQLFNDVTTTNRGIANISPTVKLAKGLVYRLNVGIDNATATNDIVNHPNLVPLRLGRLESYNNHNKNTLIENYLTYSKTLDKHSFSVMGGHSYQDILVHVRGMSINTFPISGLNPIYNPGMGQELTLVNNRPTGAAFINEIQSYFGRVNYQYDNRYMATVNFRADGSSKFGANNKYGYFPSFSLGWNIAEENFMRNSAFDILKLRGGWGITGNQEIEPKATQELLRTEVSGSTSYPLGTGSYPAGIFLSRLANPNLKWEQSKQTNIGLDFGFLNGSLTGAVDVFQKVSSNILLIMPPTDPVQPAATYYNNVPNMEVKNSGIELDLEYRKRANNLEYGIGGNFAYIKNEVTGSPYTLISTGAAQGSGLSSAPLNGYLNGYSVGSFYLLEFDGIDADGASKFVDQDKDGIITDKDRIVAGSALPKYMFSFFGNLRYKGFDLTANFNGVGGNKIYNNTANTFFYKGRIARNLNTTIDALDEPTESSSNPANISTRYLEDGGYFRLNNLVLGYTFNTHNMGINRWVKNMRLSVTAQNLFVITNYKGYDPEVNTDRSSNGVSSFGIDYLSYPKARTIIVGLNVAF